MKAVLLATFAALAASPAFAVGSAQALVGVRSGGFEAAPDAKTMTLSEVGVRVTTDPLAQQPQVTLGFVMAQQAMQGSLGRGLTSFSGVSFGPEVAARLPIQALTPYVALGYRLGRYEGRGAENWSDDELPALFLYGEDANDSGPKRFATSGAHVTAGVGWQVVRAIDVTGEVDLGFERMETDTRVLEGRDEYEDRQSTRFHSRALLVGGKMSL